MKKAIFFDIDGTLIDGAHGMPHMRAATREAIRRVQQAGHYTFIATGRPYAFLDPELLDFGFDGYILMNGAVVMLQDRIIHQQALAKEKVERICEVCDEEGVEYLLAGKHHVYLKKKFRLLGDFYKMFSISRRFFIEEFDREKTTAYKMEFLSPDNRGFACVYDRFTKESSLSGVTGVMDPFKHTQFELYARSETKGTGILHALEYLSIPVEQSFAFGDGENDLEMMDTVGTALVMGNAHPLLKEKASYIVPSVQDDGVAKGIEKFIL
jgi:Cof subfamily protein (haloacid dehalogenase superfamily)